MKDCEVMSRLLGNKCPTRIVMSAVGNRRAWVYANSAQKSRLSYDIIIICLYACHPWVFTTSGERLYLTYLYLINSQGRIANLLFPLMND